MYQGDCRGEIIMSMQTQNGNYLAKTLDSSIN